MSAGSKHQVARSDYEDGSRYARCNRCGMGWFEYEKPVELLPGWWTSSGAREHECPPPYPPEVARMWSQMAQACGGIIGSPRQKARIKLGLELAGT